MIFIDNQEVFSDITSLLDGMDVKYELVPLKVGDFHVTGKNGLAVLERKEVGDYVSSLISGHLADQLTRMSQEFELSYLLIEGSIGKALSEGRISRKTYFSSYVGTVLKRAEEGKKGIVTVVPVESNWDTAMILERMQHRLDDPEGNIRTPYIGAPHVLGGNNQVRSLCAIPGVGSTIAIALLKHFITTGRIYTATVEELKSVKLESGRRVGESVAREIFKFFRERYVEEGD